LATAAQHRGTVFSGARTPALTSATNPGSLPWPACQAGEAQGAPARFRA